MGESIETAYMDFYKAIENAVVNQGMSEDDYKGLAARMVGDLAERNLTYGQAYAVLDIVHKILRTRSLLVSLPFP